MAYEIEPAASVGSQADEGEAAPHGNTGAASSEATTRYDREIDLDSDSTHARVVRLVGTGKRVLELGPATGHMSQVMRGRGCSVVGIEIDAQMAAEAARRCERVIVGDLDLLDLDTELGDDRFDVIVAADVLEHLRDPLGVLRRVRAFLKPDGFLVISVPNIAHGSVRLALLEGHFSYQQTGLLDETHLRFFTRENIDALLDKSELAVAEIYRQELNIDASEVLFDPADVPPEVIASLNNDPEARTYQFVVKAIPMSTEGLREIQRRMRELADEVAHLRDETTRLQAEVSRHREEAAHVGAERLRSIAHLRGALIDAHDQLLRRDEELQHLREQLAQSKSELAVVREQELRLRIRLDRIQSSAPMRAFELVRELPGIRRVIAHRTAGYEAALRTARGVSEPPR
jgi:2-polyprenyl-3-methyl-5-hydroxy-6-metoxy-1,4-benzoquinol methylase